MKRNLRKKISKSQIRDFIIENLLFYVMAIIALVFVASPVWLNITSISTWVSSILVPLKTEGYKSSYVETLGALGGTAFAVCGALWTQRRFEKRAEEDRRRERLLIIYYDFQFVFDDIKKYMKIYLYKKGGTISNTLHDSDIESFRTHWKRFKVHIYDDWIANVASVSKYFTKEEIKQIYELYGEVDELNQIFKDPIDEISDLELQIAYSKMFNYVTVTFNLNPIRVENVEIKKEIYSLLEKLQEVGEI